MKILYISHGKEESGYGRYCREFLKSLKTTDNTICSRFINFSKTNDFQDETEKESANNIDLIIQNVLPHYMCKGHVKTIGGAILENLYVKKNIWGSFLDLMDEVWYPHHTLDIFKNEVEVPTALNLDEYKKDYPNISFNGIDHTFKFYWIGETSKRKNLSGLIRTYCTNFSVFDPVSLIIKCHSSDFNTKVCAEQVKEIVKTIHNGCKLYDDINHYPIIKIIPEYWPRDNIMSLHKYGDCFVSSSYGESILYPMLDALAFNNHVLSTATFATDSYAKYGKINISYSDEEEPCFGNVQTFPWYQSSNEYWSTFNIIDFGRQMRNIFENHNNKNNQEDNDLSQLSYKNIGKIMEKNL